MVDGYRWNVAQWRKGRKCVREKREQVGRPSEIYKCLLLSTRNPVSKGSLSKEDARSRSKEIPSQTSRQCER